MSNLLWVKPSPHLRDDDVTRIIMADVIIALLAPLGMSVYLFGVRSLTITITSVVSCLIFETLFNLCLKKQNTIGDCSAAVTGILIAFCLPVSVPLWIPIVGAYFAIVIVKCLFGGIGTNIVNPALAARAFLFSWPALMTRWTEPLSRPSWFRTPVEDIITTATPLNALKQGLIPSNDYLDLFIGYIGGCIGEVSSVMLIAGALYLLYRRVITLRIPIAYIGTVAVITYLFPNNADRLSFMLYQLLSGGLILGAFFMATDYTTSPMTKSGQIIYGIGCGLITVLIRYYGGYAEGVMYAILIMNIVTCLLDKYIVPKRFGGVKRAGKKRRG